MISNFLKKLRGQSQQPREPTTVFVSGIFDVLHAGHYDLLLQAAMQGDILIVGLHSDSSCFNMVLCGMSEQVPVFNQSERQTCLESLEFVNHVVLIDDLDSFEIVQQLKPNILVFGGDKPKPREKRAAEYVAECGQALSISRRVPVTSFDIKQAVRQRDQNARIAFSVQNSKEEDLHGFGKAVKQYKEKLKNQDDQDESE